MSKEELLNLHSLFVDKFPKTAIGAHLHNNLGNALDSGLSLLDDGLSWIDSTVAGMGRGPGNICTEDLLLDLHSNLSDAYKLIGLMECLKQFFHPLKLAHQWGPNILYRITSKYRLHLATYNICCSIASFLMKTYWPSLNTFPPKIYLLIIHFNRRCSRLLSLLLTVRIVDPKINH